MYQPQNPIASKLLDKDSSKTKIDSELNRWKKKTIKQANLAWMVIPESAMSDDYCISASAEVRLPDSDLGTQMRIGFPRERSIAEISSSNAHEGFHAFVEAFYLFSQSRDI
ncbi:hypothetical protein L3X38_024872 [Prunus dulcis]|uniref:Uncharacterized protein n=1 Tax=Prunus dulcis TaxID=3755 RepID=A0AAD4W0L2_PRUDU|nr:hypothetical protein L3X38_024872 [Prunus dulcis]